MSTSKKAAKYTAGGRLLLESGSDSYRARDGIIYRITGKHETKVCGKFRFVDQLHDIDDGAVRLRIRFRDGNNHEVEVLAPMSELIDRFPVRDRLVDRGLEIYDDAGFKQFLPKYWSLKRPKKKTRVTRHPGWHELDDELFYVTPTWSAASDSEGEDGLELTSNSGSAIRVQGTVKEWNVAIGSKCIGNPRLIFAVCAALAAPVLRLAKKPNIGIGFVGNSTTGKSTALSIAASVFGPPLEYVDTWDATSGALNAMALARLDAPLIIDELGECDANVMAKACYALVNGRGRRRLGAKLELNQKFQYRGIVLFSCEVSVTELLQEAGIQVNEGGAIRLLTVRGGSKGMFPALNGERDAAILAENLKRASEECYGAVGQRWINALARDADGMAVTILKSVKKTTEQLRDGLPATLPSNIISRVVDSFALIASVGEVAIAKKLVTWEKGDAVKAARTCFRAWAKNYAAERPEMTEDPLVKVKRFFQSESEGKFVPFAQYDDAKRKDLAGFLHELGGSPVFLMYPSDFEQRFCGKGGKKVLIAALIP